METETTMYIRNELFCKLEVINYPKDKWKLEKTPSVS